MDFDHVINQSFIDCTVIVSSAIRSDKKLLTPFYFLKFRVTAPEIFFSQFLAFQISRIFDLILIRSPSYFIPTSFIRFLAT